MSKASQVYDSQRDGGDYLPAERVDPREWGAAAHVEVWSKAAPNRLALVAACYCAGSLLPWLILLGFGRRAETSLWLVAFLLPLPLVGAVVSGLAYRRALPPRFAGRGMASATLFVHGIHLTFLVLSVAWSGASEPSNRLTCAAHLRSIGQSLTFYAVKYDAKYPPAMDLLILHADTPASVFVCDSTGDERATGETLAEVMKSFHADARHNSYVYAAAGLSADVATRDHVLAFEQLPNHAYAGMNVLFGDGNVRWLDRADAERLVAEISAGHNPPRLETAGADAR
jgi:prepilin-type processing-associated H-X9-DG protein